MCDSVDDDRIALELHRQLPRDAREHAVRSRRPDQHDGVRTDLLLGDGHIVDDRIAHLPAARLRQERATSRFISVWRGSAVPTTKSSAS